MSLQVQVAWTGRSCKSECKNSPRTNLKSLAIGSSCHARPTRSRKTKQTMFKVWCFDLLIHQCYKKNKNKRKQDRFLMKRLYIAGQATKGCSSGGGGWELISSFSPCGLLKKKFTKIGKQDYQNRWLFFVCELTYQWLIAARNWTHLVWQIWKYDADIFLMSASEFILPDEYKCLWCSFEPKHEKGLKLLTASNQITSEFY